MDGAVIGTVTRTMGLGQNHEECTSGTSCALDLLCRTGDLIEVTVEGS